MVPNKHSAIPQYIYGLKLYSKTHFNEICMKDSRSLTRNDLKKILNAIEKSKAKKIIVTLGTYTMPDTARFLKANLKRKDQTIILTGSMIPINGFTFSDAPFNLGFSLAKARELHAGIYVCMNGKVFLPQEIAKNISEGRFYSVFGEEKKK